MKQKLNPRSIALVVVLVAMVLLVTQDRSSSKDPAAPSLSPAATYRQASDLTRSAESMAAQRDRWRIARDEAQSAWAIARESIIDAPSVNVAESALRAFVEEVMRDAGLTLSVSSPLARDTPIEGEPLRVVGLTLDFDAPNPDTLDILLDRIENGPIRTHITDLEVRGPGRAGRQGLRVKMDVAAMAWIGGVDG